ncbi:DUF1501 domain-containing protein [Urbifossiella limnaea]|uniref:DUF1501 domain-containing protein n=1 Tax=Urbifossiella limnaea TaxID=2528023 RepID=A0A517XY65_9BACT|nr:DUF1501 domain-containing protein [Urbifossiella limnaea]QDU22431.1 hypothetical protein ETAA1_44110 [Urbifossiella limnaea]
MPAHTNCAGVSRRDCLQLGLGALLGGGLASALRAKASGPGALPGNAKACILVWMDGGPTHYEMFDPKPNAPAEFRGEFGTVATAVPGVRYSEHMKQLAGLLGKYAMIRSVRHDQGNHGAGNHYMMTGAPPRIPVGCGAFVSFHPSMGSVVAAEKGAPAGLPPYFSMPTMSRSGGPNFLGAKYAPFVVDGNPGSPAFRVRDVALPAGLTDDRFATRTDIRREVDTFRRDTDRAAADPAVALDEHYVQAHDLMTSAPAQAAFDIGREPERTRERYGRNPLGQRLLLARRLVEAGVPFVTVYDGGWDHHTKLFETLKGRLPAWDNSVAAVIEDLSQRGMLDDTLVIALGEFGRTPQINKDAGRDHWSNAMSILFAGGRTPGGRVIGATDTRGFAAVERVLSPENFVSTVYAKLGIDPGKVLYGPNGRPAHLVSDPTPIRELM